MNQYQFKELNNSIQRGKEQLEENHFSQKTKDLIRIEIAQLERTRKKVLKSNLGVVL